MSDILSVTVKRFFAWDIMEHMSLIVEYDTGRVRQLSVLDYQEIPYTIRDFICEKNFKESNVIPFDRPSGYNKIIVSRYEKRSGMNVSEYEVQE